MAQQNGVPDFTVKAGLAQMLKGGVIMDVVNAEQVCSFETIIDRLQEAKYSSYRPALLKKPVPPPSWPSNESPPISEKTVAWRACPTPA